MRIFKSPALSGAARLALGRPRAWCSFFRDYLLYLVKAGHVAVMVEYLDGKELPGGQGQITYAQGIVANRFGQASALFALDQLIKGVINVVTGLLEGLLAILPIPGLDRVVGVLRAYLKLAVGLVDEIILAHAIARGRTMPLPRRKRGWCFTPRTRGRCWSTRPG